MKKLGFGLMRLPLTNGDRKTPDLEKTAQMADRFLERGFTYFDTAYMYHDGESERVVRSVLSDRVPRESFLLADKMPIYQMEKDEQEEIFREQLEKTGAGYFDYYLLHSISGGYLPTLEEWGSFEFLKKKQQEGKIRHIGFSFHGTPEGLDEILTRYPGFEFVQLQINYLDWDSSRIQSRRCYEVARKHGKDIIVMEPVKGGTLAEIPAGAKAILDACTPGMSPASWAIRWVASLPGVILVLSGMSTLEQVENNLSFMEDFRPLSEAEQEAIRKVTPLVRAGQIIPCTACSYCVDGCPQNIPIPEIFRVCNADYRHAAGNADEAADGTNSAYVRYADAVRGRGSAASCLACGRCEAVCPQQIEIIKELKKAANMFE